MPSLQTVLVIARTKHGFRNMVNVSLKSSCVQASLLVNEERIYTERIHVYFSELEDHFLMCTQAPLKHEHLKNVYFSVLLFRIRIDKLTQIVGYMGGDLALA